MGTKIYLSSLGRPVDPAEATVSVFDRGFLYGDSVYETLRTSGGQPVDWQPHVDRLHRSAEGIGLELPMSDDALRAVVMRTLAASDNADSKVRIVVTRGTGPIALDVRTSSDPQLVVFVEPLKLPPPEQNEQGISAAVVQPPRNLRTVEANLKTGNYLPNIQALRKAIEQRGEDAIMCNHDGEVAEGATSNLFMVEGGQLHTPPVETGLLPGITRGTIIRIALEQGIGVSETRFKPDRLAKADEVFLTSSVRAVMPVTRLDGRPVGRPVEGGERGSVGPVTRRMMRAYAEHVAAHAK